MSSAPTDYPRSNVRLLPASVPTTRKPYVLTLDSFGGCEECAAGVHGREEEGRPGTCLCCRWPFGRKAGDVL